MEELVESMADTAFQFEAYVIAQLPKDGSKDEAFDTWREAFYEAFDRPHDQDAAAFAEVALTRLHRQPKK